MARAKSCSLVILFTMIASFMPFMIQGGELKKDAPVFPTMPSVGTKVPVGNDHYLIYGFDKKPKLGTIIMKIEIHARDGSKDTSFEVLGDSGMPSMKGAHETGEQPFRLSNKGAYLLPVNIVMPGDWEVRITIKKNGKVIFRGSHQFDV
jgi:hypothetical protein